MPPFCENGSTICVYLWWGLTCKFCAEGNCQARSGTTREKDPDVINAMREEDDTYKGEWLEYKEECSGETPGPSNRKTTKQKEKSDKQTAGMQSRVGKMESKMKETFDEMSKLTRENGETVICILIWSTFQFSTRSLEMHFKSAVFSISTYSAKDKYVAEHSAEYSASGRLRSTSPTLDRAFVPATVQSTVSIDPYSGVVDSNAQTAGLLL